MCRPLGGSSLLKNEARRAVSLGSLSAVMSGGPLAPLCSAAVLTRAGRSIRSAAAPVVMSIVIVLSQPRN